MFVQFAETKRQESITEFRAVKVVKVSGGERFNGTWGTSTRAKFGRKRVPSHQKHVADVRDAATWRAHGRGWWRTS